LRRCTNSSAARAVYDGIADRYESFIAHVQYGIPAWFDVAIRAFPGASPRVLDLACGTGQVGDFLASASIFPKTLVGLDISPAMVAACKKKGRYTRVATADLARGIPAKITGKFDLITAFGVTEFFEDCAPFLKSAARRLSPHGEIWLSFEISSRFKKNEMHFDNRVLTSFTRTRIRVLAEVASAGLTALELNLIPGYRSLQHQKIVKYLVMRLHKSD